MTTRRAAKTTTPETTFTPEMERVAAHLIRQTAPFAELASAGTTTPETDPKSKAISEAVKEFSDQYQAGMVKVLNIALDRKFVIPMSHYNYNDIVRRGGCFVPLAGSRNGHNYTVNQVNMFKDDRYPHHHIRTNSEGRIYGERERFGNTMDWSAEAIRPATPEEIRSYVERNYDLIVDLLGLILI